MFDRFKDIKEAFRGKPKPGEPPNSYSIELPNGIGEDDDPGRGIQNGRIKITEYVQAKRKRSIIANDCSDDLEQMFQGSVIGTLDLIDEQITLVGPMNVKVSIIV